jgi:trehalose/maltose hydrolase-like predicted phosphorylase
MVSPADPSSLQSLSIGPLTAIASSAHLDPEAAEPFAIGSGGQVDPVKTTFERPIFEHSVSWSEFAKDPNRYTAQIFMGNGNFTETGITASLPPTKEKQRAGYDNPYVQIEYAAAFKAGVSVFRTTDVEGGRTVANSCCPHLPYLSYHRVKEPAGPWYHNALDCRTRFAVVNAEDAGGIQNRVKVGTVAYALVLQDRETGHTITHRVEKFASFARPELACTRLELEPDFAGDLLVVSGFDGTLINNLYDGYNKFQQVHTEKGPQGAVVFGPRTIGLSLQTVRESEENIRKLEASEYHDNPASTTPQEVRNQAQYQFGLTKSLRYFLVDVAGTERELEPELLSAQAAGVEVVDPAREVYVIAKVHLERGQRLVVEDHTTLVSSIDKGVAPERTLEVARDKLGAPARYKESKAAHVAEWQKQFAQGRIALFGGKRAMELQAPVDLCRAALLKTVSGHNRNIAADMGAKGLHDGRYRTHNFWEMAILFWKVKAIQDPDAAKGLARLYIKNIDSARAYAKSMGRKKGAQFGWQTTADGKPDTQVVKWNGVAQQWDPDFSKYQPHNNWAFFYGIDQIYRVSGDRAFLLEAMPLLIELVRFGADSCVKQADGKFHSIGMMDPNEYNEKLPGSTLPNLPDSFYNNFMIAKAAARLFELLEELDVADRERTLGALAVSREELDQIKSLATNMYFPITTAPKRGVLVDLSGNVLDELEIPAGTIENYQGFTDMPLLHWSSMPAWIKQENERRVAQGKKEIKPHFTPAGVIPRADQVLKAVELRPQLGELVADIMVGKGRWKKAADPSDPELVVVSDAASGEAVWKLDRRSDCVFAGKVASPDIQAYRDGKLAPEKRDLVKPLLNTPDNFQIGKQQGSLQTVANFSAQEVVELLKANGYAVDLGTIGRNVDFYDKRVNTNGSSLANVGTGVGKISLGELKASLENYDEVVHLDAKDSEAGTARQGFRAGNMAASELMPIIYLGLDLNASRGKLSLDPKIPRDIGGIELLDAAFGRYRLFIRADGQRGSLELRAAGLAPGEKLAVTIRGKTEELGAGETRSFAIPVSQS